MSGSPFARLRGLSVVMAIAALGICSSARAEITIGQLGPLAQIRECGPASGRDYLQGTVASGNGYVVPTAGLLTSWTTMSEKTGSMGLKIFRPVAGRYSVLAVDGPMMLPASLPKTFPVSIPVLAGDVVGIEAPPFAGAGCTFDTGFDGDVVRYRVERTDVGGTVDFDQTETGGRLNISATLLPPPVITTIAPASSSIAGANLTIYGANFKGTGVTLRSAAVSYTVDSESQITAAAPPSTTLGPAAVAVTTKAGTGTGVLTYEGCTVPKLLGKKLKASRKAARGSDCKIGKVTKRRGANGRTGRVVKQVPKPGGILAPGTTIKVTLKP